MKPNALSNQREAEPEPPITAVVADDSPLFLQVVCQRLREQGRIKVVAAVKNGLEAVRETTLRHPGLVLLDVRMPGMNGPEAAAIIHANYPEVSVVLMSGAEIDEVEERCDESGASVFILKQDLLARITSDIEAAESHPGPRKSRRSKTAAVRRSARPRRKRQ